MAPGCIFTLHPTTYSSDTDCQAGNCTSKQKARTCCMARNTRLKHLDKLQMKYVIQMFKNNQQGRQYTCAIDVFTFYCVCCVALELVTQCYMTDACLSSQAAGVLNSRELWRPSRISPELSCEVWTWCVSGKGEQGEWPDYIYSFLSFSSLLAVHSESEA